MTPASLVRLTKLERLIHGSWKSSLILCISHNHAEVRRAVTRPSTTQTKQPARWSMTQMNRATMQSQNTHTAQAIPFRPTHVHQVCYTVLVTLCVAKSEKRTDTLIEPNAIQESLPGPTASLYSNAVNQHPDESPVLVPYLSPSIGASSDDANMTEPGTPQTSTSSIGSEAASKHCESTNGNDFRITADSKTYDDHDFGTDLNINLTDGMIEHPIAQEKSPMQASPATIDAKVSSSTNGTPEPMPLCFQDAITSSPVESSSQFTLRAMSTLSPSVTYSERALKNRKTSEPAQDVDAPLPMDTAGSSSLFTCTQCSLVFPTHGKLK